MNDTIKKFGYPETLVKEYEHWAVLLRPRQVTLGSLVLACKDQAASLPEIPGEAFVELKQATRELELAIRHAFQFERINYLMLMMVDPDVHFHVIPRYAGKRNVDGIEFEDVGWPKHPDMTRAHDVSKDVFARIRQILVDAWPT